MQTWRPIFISFSYTGSPTSVQFLVSCCLLWLKEILKVSKRLMQQLNFAELLSKRQRVIWGTFRTRFLITHRWFYYLKLLKRSGASVEDLLCFYTAIVRPVMEYASPVWYYGLTVEQSNTLESLQKRALTVTIIFYNSDYATTLTLFGLTTLKSRREQLIVNFFPQ